MALEATQPTTIDETYDRWAFTFGTSGDGCVSIGQDSSEVLPIMAFATLVKARVRPDGVWEKSPDPRDTKRIVVDDLLATSQTNPLVAQAYAAIVAAVQSIAAEQGAL